MLLGCGTAESSLENEDDATLDDPQELRSSGYSAKVTTNPSPVTVGSLASLDIKINGPRKTQVTEFDSLHTQSMHLIAVSSDLEDFIHVHPALQPAGNLTVNATFSRAQPYALFMEYDPAGRTQPKLSRVRVAPANSRAAKAKLSATDAFDGSASKTVTVEGTKVELVGTPGGMFMPNMAAHVVVRFKDAGGGSISNLTDWLGMPAHAIVLSPDLKTFQHLHGTAEATSGSGASGHGDHGNMGSTKTGPVGVDFTISKAGLYKMFVQFQRGTKVITAPFVLSVMDGHAPSAPPASCATTTCPNGQSCMVMGSPPLPMCM